jgi:hypothetical protein
MERKLMKRTEDWMCPLQQDCIQTLEPWGSQKERKHNRIRPSGRVGITFYYHAFLNDTKNLPCSIYNNGVYNQGCPYNNYF